MDDGDLDDLLLPIAALRREFAGVDLGDLRLENRVQSTVAALGLHPRKSVLSAAANGAEASAIYRLLENPRVTSRSLVEPHLDMTAQRCAEAGRVLAIHDTSEFSYSGKPRAGLGKVRSKTDQGFLLHATLAVEEGGGRRPLGVLAMSTWTRTAKSTSRVNGRRKSGPEYAKQKVKESDRWAAQVAEAESRVGGRAQVVHVADREADAYPLLCGLVEHGQSFVVRLARNRNAREDESVEPEKLLDIAWRARGVVEMNVDVVARPATTIPGRRKTFGAREARQARLEIASAAMDLKRPRYLHDEPDWLSVNVVHVREVDPLPGSDAIDWLLVTSEPTETVRDCLAVIEIYRTRWLIEEFFKALKTGCAMEERELESLHTLTNALALFLPIAYMMLLLRHVARSEPSAPAATVINPTQIHILETRAKLPRGATASDALMAVAYLGGHFPRYARGRPPGWIVLARGMERLLLLEEGWAAAVAARRSGQT